MKILFPVKIEDLPAGIKDGFVVEDLSGAEFNLLEQIAILYFLIAGELRNTFQIRSLLDDDSHENPVSDN